jgi:hypothetical protein
MDDPFRSDLQAAHGRIQQLEEEVARLQAAGPPTPPTPPSEPTGGVRLWHVASAAVMGIALGVTAMIGAVRTRSRALADCTSDFESERLARRSAEEQLLRRSSTLTPGPYILPNRVVGATVQSTRARLIEDAIVDIFERRPRPGELDIWTSKPGDARSVRDAIARSTEVEDQLQAIFTKAHGRRGTLAELAPWVTLLASGSNMAAVRSGISAGAAPGRVAE